MEKPSDTWVVVLLASATLLAAQGSAGAQVGAGPTVTCDGRACGGSGGTSASPFLYRVDPRNQATTSFEIPVEDGNLANYRGLAAPPGWSWEILALARPHNEFPVEHGTSTGSAGTCPYVLRFFGPQQAATFEVGFAYIGKPGFHEVRWKASGGFQAAWNHGVGSGRGPVHSPMRLNVLVIVLDDVGTDKLTMYDELYAGAYEPAPTADTLTPRLDALAAQGVRFTNYYTNPVCSASRACLLTGRYSLRTGLGLVAETTVLAGCVDPVPEPGEVCFQLQDDEVFLPELLKAGFLPGASMTSGAFGKYHLSYWTPPADLTPRPGLESHALDNGFDRFFGLMQNVRALGGNHYDWWKVEHDVAIGGPNVFQVAGTWNATVAREDAVSWINDRSGPFFAWVAFNPPHVPPQLPPLELVSQETRDRLELCEQQTGGACTDKPLIFRAMLEAVDTEIGNLLDQIDPVKLAHTMVFAVSDNGTQRDFIRPPHDATHGKTSVFQIGVRVPLIVAGPLVPEAADGSWRADQLVHAVDLWRTVESITGADEQLAFQTLGVPPCRDPWIDSRSFADVIEDPSSPGPRAWAFSQVFPPNTAVPSRCQTILDSPGYACLFTDRRAITDGEFKLHRRRVSPLCSLPVVYDERFYWTGPVGRAGADVSEGTDLLDASGTLVAAAPAHAQAALDALRRELTALCGD